MLRLAVLASGGGSNLQSIIDAASAGSLGPLYPVLVVVDRPCGAVDRARTAGIPVEVLDRRKWGRRLTAALETVLDEYRIDLAALAGWLSILDGALTRRWSGRMVNIHPALLPKHGGPGMYGRRVHQAVLDAEDAESGCTVHFVSEGIDEGEILDAVSVPVRDDDTAESLAARVLVQEHRLYPRVLAELALTIDPRTDPSSVD